MLLNYLLIPITLILLLYVIVELKRIKHYLKNDIVDEISSTMEVQKDDLQNHEYIDTQRNFDIAETIIEDILY